jgi:hypothetical protein
MAMATIRTAPDNHPFYGTAIIGKAYGKSSQPSGRSSTKPGPKVSLSDEQRAEAQKMKEAHIKELHQNSLLSQSETPEKPSS